MSDTASSSKQGTSLWRSLGEEKRQQVFHAAMEEFAGAGYSGASMNTLSRNAGVSKGSLFGYFKSKSGLFDALVRTAMERVRNLLKQVRDTSREQSFPDRVEAVLNAGLEFIDEHPLLARIYFQLLRTGDSPFSNTWMKRLNREALEFLTELVQDAQARQELRRDVPAEEIAFSLNAILDHALAANQRPELEQHGAWNNKDRQQRMEWARRQANWLTHGLAPHSESPEDACT